jgi:putative flippase GtrA
MMGSSRQFLVFALVGLLNTAVHYCVFLLLFRAFGMPMLLASALGYASGVANSYFMNRRWTFRVAAPPSTVEFLRFALVNLASLSVNLAALEFLVAVVGLAPEAAQVAAILASLVVNFVGNKKWALARRT